MIGYTLILDRRTITYAASKKAAKKPPHFCGGLENGAGDGTRTRDLLITNQLLYQLSYTGIWYPSGDLNPEPID